MTSIDLLLPFLLAASALLVIPQVCLGIMTVLARRLSRQAASMVGGILVVLVALVPGLAVLARGTPTEAAVGRHLAPALWAVLWWLPLVIPCSAAAAGAIRVAGGRWHRRRAIGAVAATSIVTTLVWVALFPQWNTLTQAIAICGPVDGASSYARNYPEYIQAVAGSKENCIQAPCSLQCNRGRGSP